MKKFKCQWRSIALGIMLGATAHAGSQTTVFTYQGRLIDNGSPALGVYDLSFSLFDALSGGTQIGNAVTNTSVGVTNGLFSVSLDFGANFPGANRWLEIGVRPGGSSGAFALLSPRQRLTSTPYAITAGNLSGTLAASQLTGTVPPALLGSLTNHNDVSAASLAGGQVLAYSGTVWTNGPIPSSAIPSPSNNIPVTLAFSGTNVPVNASQGTHFRLLATNNFLLQNPTGAGDAQRLMFEIIQDATGGRLISLGGAFKLGADLPFLTLTTNANARDFITCVRSGTNFYVLGFIKGY